MKGKKKGRIYILRLFISPELGSLHSWHVYNQNNRDRVRRDEEQAKAEDEKLTKRANLAVSHYNAFTYTNSYILVVVIGFVRVVAHY